MRQRTTRFLCATYLVAMGLACIVGGGYLLYDPGDAFNGLIGLSAVALGVYLVRPVIKI